jgi:hypothetical protein
VGWSVVTLRVHAAQAPCIMSTVNHTAALKDNTVAIALSFVEYTEHNNNDFISKPPHCVYVFMGLHA